MKKIVLLALVIASLAGCAVVPVAPAPRAYPVYAYPHPYYYGAPAYYGHYYR